MSALKSECRKFSPNVFNKIKCQNCFRTKDVHSAEALENNRASRNVSKCGYLFVAPDWDFNVSVNRTKRWQRRWFVLYDDGELTYALDEFPDTIPQGTIDLNKVQDVSDAEGVTGNEFAIAVHSHDKMHFVKGTSKEESRWWFDALQRVLPRHLSRAKHKRNATLPCVHVAVPRLVAQDVCSEDDLHVRPKFLSSSEMDGDWTGAGLHGDEDVFEVDSTREGQINTPNEYVEKDPLSQLEELDSRRRSRRYLKRENRVARSQRSRVEGVSKMLPAKNMRTTPLVESQTTHAMAAAEKLEYLESINPSDRRRNSVSEVKEENRLEALPNQDVLLSTVEKPILRKSESLRDIPSETQHFDEMRDRVCGLRRYHSFKSTTSPSSLRMCKSGKSKFTSTSLPRIRKISSDTTSPSAKNTKSDSTSSLDLCGETAQEGVFVRTGWLMRQTLSKDWSKHWFVLRDSSFAYYRDPSAEHCGIMDGILDLNQVSTIREHDTDRFRGFALRMWDGKKHILAAETLEFRNMWMQALHYASNLWSSASKEDFICTEITLPEHSFHYSDRSSDRIASPSSLCSLPIAYDGKDMSSSDDQSEYFSLVDDDEVSDLSSSPRTLPPSPPINRNVMSLVKEKSRIRSVPKNANCTVCEDGQSKCPDSETERCYKSDLCSNQLEGDTNRVEAMNKVIGQGKTILPSPEIHRRVHSLESRNSERLLKFETPENSTELNISNTGDDVFSPDISKVSTPKTRNECGACVKTKSKLVAAREEIRKLKVELKEAYASFDNLEMFSYKLTQDVKLKEENYNSQIALMTAKIDDLTSKFTLAEKNYRQLKQKTTKSENKERRRSSLKNREGLSLTKEYEVKLCELEAKIVNIESTLQRESSETDESERTSLSQSITSEKNDVQESISSTELASGESKGLFSRLQTLGSRVESVHDSLEQNSVIGQVPNPKILLQIRENDDAISINSSNDFLSLSLNNSLLEVYPNSYPNSVSEFQNLFEQKLCNILEWMKLSLESMRSQNYASDTEKSFIVRNLLGIIDSLLQVTRSRPLSQTKNSNTLVFLVSEINSTLNEIEKIDSLECLLRSKITECAFVAMLKTLCVSFAEYENSNPTKMLTLLSEIPQVRFFCPIINNLLPESIEDSQNLLSTSERLLSLKHQQSTAFHNIQEAKKLRFQSLWDTLAEVPVQDDNARKPIVVNSILQYITSIAEDIHRISELQLTGYESQAHNVLKFGHNEIETWCSKTKIALKTSLDAFMDELKELCPMVHESTVTLTELGDSTRKDITNLVSELSFLCVCGTILTSLLSHSPETVNSTDYFESPEKWMRRLGEKQFNNPNLFSCHQCSTLHDFLCDSSSAIDWSSYVQEYNSHQRKKEHFQSFESPNKQSSMTGCQESSRKSAKDACNNLTCVQCDGWVSKLFASEKQHEIERQSLQIKHNEELQQLEECLIKSSEVHDQEMLEKENELSEIKSKQLRLKLECEEQMETLKHLYEQKLNYECNKADENSIRNIYKTEMEDLKGMFKKGLVAIENSHQRLASELERRHKEELDMLETEKDRALQLEAEATITALEAIKKSHELQLQQETALIKDSLVSQYTIGESYDSFYCTYGNDLEKLKLEILNITDLYSSKCMENVALEENLNSLRHQLKDAHNELYDLLTKNEQMGMQLQPLAAL